MEGDIKVPKGENLQQEETAATTKCVVSKTATSQSAEGGKAETGGHSPMSQRRKGQKVSENRLLKNE